MCKSSKLILAGRALVLPCCFCARSCQQPAMWAALFRQYSPARHSTFPITQAASSKVVFSRPAIGIRTSAPNAALAKPNAKNASCTSRIQNNRNQISSKVDRVKGPSDTQKPVAIPGKALYRNRLRTSRIRVRPCSQFALAPRHDNSVALLDQHMARMVQLRFLSLPVARQFGVRVCLELVRVVGPPSSPLSLL